MLREGSKGQRCGRCRGARANRHSQVGHLQRLAPSTGSHEGCTSQSTGPPVHPPLRGPICLSIPLPIPPSIQTSVCLSIIPPPMSPLFNQYFPLLGPPAHPSHEGCHLPPMPLTTGTRWHETQEGHQSAHGHLCLVGTACSRPIDGLLLAARPLCPDRCCHCHSKYLGT